MSTNYIFQGSVSEIDPELSQLLQREDDRQDSTIILIASESASPEAVREAMSSNFGNIYAEGYPREEPPPEPGRHHGHGPGTGPLPPLQRPRYYKGVEYADMLEALTRRRAAELFAANGVKPDQLYVNVQPLSGAPANSAVYTALLQPGDTIMGLNLNDGGHLSHGSRVNRSGKIYNSAPYFVDPQSEVLDYDAIENKLWKSGRKLSSPVTRLILKSSTGSASATSPTNAARTSWPISPTSPGWWPPACIPAPSASPTS
ncbi:MAG: hypothetical protein IPK53_07365 [bacterium]|nr:hypothetical protein [bacterium]